MPDIDALIRRIDAHSKEYAWHYAISTKNQRALVEEFKRLRAIEDAVRKVGTFEHHDSDNNRALVKALERGA